MYQYKNIIIAGINTEEQFKEWLNNGKPDTGYTFVRKLDDTNMGQVIYLGVDYSEIIYGLSSTPRPDSPEYYYEKEIIYENKKE